MGGTMLDISVVSPIGDEPTSLAVDRDSATIADIKALLTEKLKVPSSEQHLLLGPRVVEDNESVAHLLDEAAKDPPLELEYFRVVQSKVPEFLRVHELSSVSDKKKKNGYTALHLAIEKKKEDVCLDILLDEGFDTQSLNAKEWDHDRTVLHCAVLKALSGVCQAILSRHDFKEINACDTGTGAGRTALHLAADKGLSEVCLAILARPDFEAINQRDAKGCTALHYASLRGLSAVCHEILEREDFLEAEAEDENGKTALHHADHDICNWMQKHWQLQPLPVS
jgi:ankyrin repeat protein